MEPVDANIPQNAEWVTLAQAAARLQVSWKTVRRMCEDGRLEARRVGRGIRVRRSSLDAFGKAV